MFECMLTVEVEVVIGSGVVSVGALVNLFLLGITGAGGPGQIWGSSGI
jgi:hypothetical protein